MILEGDTSVIDAIKEKKRLMDAGEEHSHIRPLLMMTGGLMKGVYGVGAVRAMNALQYDAVFYAAMGISAGAPTIAYLLGKNAQVGGRVIYEDCCTKTFFNLWRFWSPMNSAFFQEAVEGKTGKPYAVDTVLRHATDFRIGTTCFLTGEPRLVTPKTAEELFVGTRASVSVPGACAAAVWLHGERLVDGSASDPHTLEAMWDAVPEATHVLIIANQDKETKKIGWPERLMLETAYRFRMSSRLRHATTHRRRIRHEFIERKLSEAEKPLAITWGDGFIGSFEQNPAKVEAGVDRSEVWWRELLQ